jgi:transcriptional regulator with XRE-family HTH domain
MQKRRPYEDRAERLKKLRGEAPVDVFAKELGINIATYYRYERGETQISDGHLRLAEILRNKRQHDNITISEPAQNYDPHGGYNPDFEKSSGIQRGSPMWRAFELLSKIYASEDPGLIGAIYSNLKTFAETVEQRRENAGLKRTVGELSARLDQVVEQLNQKGIVHFREKRNGADRRQVADPDWPDGEERRSGQDRRKAAPD